MLFALWFCSIASALDLSPYTVTAMSDGSCPVQVQDPNAPILASSDFVTDIGGPISGSTVNTLIGANTFYSNGYTGTQANMSVIDAGSIWNGHETLTQVSTFVYDASAGGQIGQFDRHATWVGQDRWRPYGTNYKEGIAPSGTLTSGAIATSWVGTAYAVNLIPRTIRCSIRTRTGRPRSGRRM